jgi:hypothetical protein
MASLGELLTPMREGEDLQDYADRVVAQQKELEAVQEIQRQNPSMQERIWGMLPPNAQYAGNVASTLWNMNQMFGPLHALEQAAHRFPWLAPVRNLPQQGPPGRRNPMIGE